MKRLLLAIGLVGATSVRGEGREIYLTASDTTASSVNSAGQWSSGKAPEPGYDYVVTNNIALYVQPSSWSGTHVFGGDRLILRNAKSFSWLGSGSTQWLDVNLAIEGSTQLWPNNHGRIINLLGTLTLAEGASLRCATTWENAVRGFCLRSNISGSGTLLIYLARYDTSSYPKHYFTPEKFCRLEGDNSDFAGRIVAGGCGNLYILSEDSLGRAPDAFSDEWLTLHGTHLCVTNDVTISSQTRGIYFSNEKRVKVEGLTMEVGHPGGGFDVAEGKTLTISSPLKAEGPIVKYGAGTLVLSMPLDNVTHSVVVTNGSLAFGGTEQVLSVPLTVAASASLKLGDREASVQSLVMAAGSRISLDLAGCDAATPRLTVTDALTREGRCIALDVVGAGTPRVPYALIRAPFGTFADWLRHGRIFLAEPWRGTLAVVDNGDRTETLSLTCQEADKTYYAVEEGQKCFMTDAVWKKNPTDADESPSVAAADNVYVAGVTVNGKQYGLRSSVAGTFPGDRLVLKAAQYTNKIGSNKSVTIPDFTTVGSCSLGFSNAGKLILDGAMTILPDADDVSAVALNCDGRNAYRPLELRSDLSGCGTIALVGDMPPRNEYNLYGLYGENTNFVGQIRVSGQTNFYCRIEKEENLGGNPETFTADVLRFNGGGLSVARNVTLDDSNRGIYLDGTGGIAGGHNENGCYWAKSGYVEADRVYHGGATFNTTAADVTLVVNCPISGTGGVYIRASGTVALGGANSHTGTNVVQTGTLRVDSATALGAGALAVWENGVLEIGVDDEKMPYGLELGDTVTFAMGAKVTLSGVGEAELRTGRFTVPLLLLAVGQTLDVSSIPFFAPEVRGYRAGLSSRLVTVGGVERQFVEATYRKSGFSIILR